MPQIQCVPEAQKAVASGIQRIQTAQPEPKPVEPRVKLPEQRHTLIDLPEINLYEDRANRPAREHLIRTCEYPVFCPFHIDLQDIDTVDAVLHAKMIDRIRLDLNLCGLAMIRGAKEYGP